MMSKWLHILYKISVLFVVALTLLGSCNNKQSASGFYHPAEFESCDYTSFVWTDDTNFHDIVSGLVGIVSQKDKVRVYVEEASPYKKQLPDILKEKGANLNNVEIIGVDILPTSVWLRDYGPVYLVADDGRKKIVNFQYFGKEQSFNPELATERSIPVIRSELSSSGGAREVNGEGTILLCETHELDVNRPKSKRQIGEEIKDVLNVEKIIWLKHGIPQDDNPLNGPLFQEVYPNGVNGHVDEFCRFADANTILISTVTENEAKKLPILAEAKKRLDENYNILINSTDQDGDNFNVIKIPFAPVLIAKSPVQGKMKYTTPVTSYMNFIITNSYIILPSYISSANDSNREMYEAKENEVVKLFQNIFSDKEIVKVPSAQLNFYSGGFHCLSIHEPEL